MANQTAPVPAAPPGGTLVPPAMLEHPAGPSMIVSLAPFLVVIGIFYFLVIRPQQKQQKDTEKLHAGLKRGDRVITSGGLHGTIADFKEAEKAVVLEVAPGVKLTVTRASVTTVRREALPPAHAGK